MGLLQQGVGNGSRRFEVRRISRPSKTRPRARFLLGISNAGTYFPSPSIPCVLSSGIWRNADRSMGTCGPNVFSMHCRCSTSQEIMAGQLARLCPSKDLPHPMTDTFLSFMRRQFNASPKTFSSSALWADRRSNSALFCSDDARLSSNWIRASSLLKIIT